jgi:hypothetical protein
MGITKQYLLVVSCGADGSLAYDLCRQLGLADLSKFQRRFTPGLIRIRKVTGQ